MTTNGNSPVLPAEEFASATVAMPLSLQYTRQIEMRCDNCGAKGTAWFRSDADSQYQQARQIGHCRGECRFCGEMDVQVDIVPTPIMGIRRPRHKGAPPTPPEVTEVPAAVPATVRPSPPADVCIDCGQGLFPFEMQLKPTRIGNVCVVCRARWGMDQRYLLRGRRRQRDHREDPRGWEMGARQEIAYRAYEDLRA